MVDGFFRMVSLDRVVTSEDVLVNLVTLLPLLYVSAAFNVAFHLDNRLHVFALPMPLRFDNKSGNASEAGRPFRWKELG